MHLNKTKAKVAGYLKIMKLPAIIWIAWGLFAYVIISFLEASYYYCTLEGCNISHWVVSPFVNPSPANLFAFFDTYLSAFSLLLAFVLSFWGGWRGVKKYKANVKKVCIASVMTGLILGTIFMGPSVVFGNALERTAFVISLILLCIFLSLFAALGAIAAKEK